MWNPYIMYINPYWLWYNGFFLKICQSTVSDLEAEEARSLAYVLSVSVDNHRAGDERHRGEVKGKKKKKKWCGEIRIEWINQRRRVEDVRRGGKGREQEEGSVGEQSGERSRYGSRCERREMTKKMRKRRGEQRTTDKRADSLPPHSHVTQFTMFWSIMFYSTISDSTVVSSDLISQPISFSNVNTKGKSRAISSVQCSSTATHA